MNLWITNSLDLIEFIAEKALAPPLFYFVCLGLLYVVVDIFRGLFK